MLMNRMQSARQRTLSKIRKLRAKNQRWARIKALWTRIKSQGRSELMREGRRLMRHLARNQIRRVVPFYSGRDLGSSPPPRQHRQTRTTHPNWTDPPDAPDPPTRPDLS